MFDIEDVIKIVNKLGYSSLRGNQEDIILSILNGNDTIGLMATGGGKTLCYQIPSLMLDGWTMVISPLIALMDDQVNSARKIGINAVKISGYMDFEEKAENLNSIVDNNNGLLLLSPEMLKSPFVADKISKNNPVLIVFDEAHCISTWGQDFRPEYAEIGLIIKELEKKHILRLALTATASDDTINDIYELSNMNNPNIIKSTLYRNNLLINLSYDSSLEGSCSKILEEVKVAIKLSKPIIIYGKTRKECDFLSKRLNEIGISNVIHHSGLEIKERQSNAELFLTSQVKVIVATMGFGMGIDKKDVYLVIHTQVPGTAEAWYQEIGRGGRDGSNSFSIGHVSPGVTERISVSNLFRNNSYQFSLKMAKTLLFNKCRMQSLLMCFNENIVEPCGKCDICCNRQEFFNVDVNDIINRLNLIKAHKNNYQSDLLNDVLYAYGLIDYLIHGNQFKTILTPTLTLNGLNYHLNPFNVEMPVYTNKYQTPKTLADNQKTRFYSLVLDNHYHYLLGIDKLSKEDCIKKIKSAKALFENKIEEYTKEVDNNILEF